MRLSISIILILALVLFSTINSKGYEYPTGHEELIALETEVTGGFKTLAIMDVNGDLECDYGLFYHEDLERNVIETEQMTCPDVSRSINEWIKVWRIKNSPEGF